MEDHTTADIQWNPYDKECPTRKLLDRIGGKWTILVIGVLAHGPMRFGELQKTIDGISQKMLTQTLRGLEEDGLVLRTIIAQIPPRVDYELTDLGRSLIQPLAGLEEWARVNMSTVLKAREEYMRR